MIADGNAKDMDNNCNIKNFTALIGFPLSDQTEEGVGNLGPVFPFFSL